MSKLISHADGRQGAFSPSTYALQDFSYADHSDSAKPKCLRKDPQLLKPVPGSQHRPSQLRAPSRSRNTLESHASTGKSSSKHMSGQKGKKVKSRDLSQLNGKRGSVNIHTVRSNAFKGVSGKQRDKSLESAANKHPTASNLQLGDDMIRTQIRNMLQILENTKIKDQSETPANQVKPVQRKLADNHRKDLSSGKHTPCGKSRARKAQVARTQENDSLSNKTTVLRNVQCNFARSVNPEAHRGAAKAAKNAGGKSASKERGKAQEKAVKAKELRKRCVKENVESYNVEVNRKSVAVVKMNPKDELEEVSPEDKLTVIEHDCENNYDLICKSLQGKYYQF